MRVRIPPTVQQIVRSWDVTPEDRKEIMLRVLNVMRNPSMHGVRTITAPVRCVVASFDMPISDGPVRVTFWGNTSTQPGECILLDIKMERHLSH
jgi:hypothetical protein